MRQAESDQSDTPFRAITPPSSVRKKRSLHRADVHTWLNETFGQACLRQRETTSLDCFHMVMINKGDSVLRGKFTPASADGRRRGEPISNGNQPSAGRDGRGLTALLKSMSKLDPSCHAGATHNLKLNSIMFQQHFDLVKALVEAYFVRGTQLMITVIDRQELELALENPAAYRNLIVRVGGYSDRFVNLPREIQMEVIRRTLY